MYESHIRSLVKGISYRIFGTLSTILISFVITGQLAVALSIGVLELVSKIFLYYFHERLWQIIPFGKKSENTIIK